MELWRYYRIIYRRRWPILFAVVALMGVTAYALWGQAKVWQASSAVRQVVPISAGSSAIPEGFLNPRPELTQATNVEHARSAEFLWELYGVLTNSQPPGWKSSRTPMETLKQALDREHEQWVKANPDLQAANILDEEYEQNKQFLDDVAGCGFGTSITPNAWRDKFVQDYFTASADRNSLLINFMVRVPADFAKETSAKKHYDEKYTDPANNIDGEDLYPGFAGVAARAAALVFKYTFKDSNYDPVKVAGYLKTQVDAAKADLDAKQAAVEAYKRTHNVTDLNTAAAAKLGRIADMDAQWRTAQATAVEADRRVAATQKELNRLPLTREEQKTTGENSLWLNLAQQLSVKEQDLAAMLASGRGENHPEVKAIRESINDLRSMQAKESREKIIQTVDAVNPVHSQTLNTFIQAKVESIGGHARANALGAVVPQMKAELSEFPENERAILTLMADAQAAEQSYNTVFQRYTDAKVRADEPYKVGDISVVHYDPKARAATSRVLQFALALPLALLLAFGVVLLLDYLDTTVRSPDQAEDLLGLPVVTMVPLSKHPSLVKSLPDPKLRESYEMLTAELWHLKAKDPGAGAILVAGVGAGAGRSTTASNLATALAGDGARVILVDADLRNPTQHVLFGVDNSKGLSNALTGSAGLEDVALPTKVEGLLLVPSGPAPENPIRILRGEAMEQFLNDATGVADFVVFDSPAGGSFADATVLASLIKRVLLVQAAGKPPTGAEGEFRMRLEQVGAQFLGVLFNRVRKDDMHSSYMTRPAPRYLPPAGGQPPSGTVSPTSPAIPG